MGTTGTIASILSYIVLTFAIFVPFFIYRIYKESIETTKLLRTAIEELRAIRKKMISNDKTGNAIPQEGSRKVRFDCVVKEYPSGGMKKVGELKFGEIVRVLKTKDGWCSVGRLEEPNTHIGWVDKDFLEE